MQRLLGVLLLFICYWCSGQAGNSISWYKLLSGTIGQYPVTFHLHKAGNIYTGYYYYNSQQNPIYFSGEDTTKKGTIKLALFAMRGEEEMLSFSFVNGEAKGEWKQNSNSKPLIFKATEVPAPMAFQYIYTKGSTLLRPNLKESPQAYFEAAAVWPVGNSAPEQAVKNIIRQSFSSKDASAEIGAVFLKGKKDVFADYAKEFKNVTEKEIKEAPYIYSFDETNRVMVVYNSAKIITLAHYNYAYTGGAHGNYGTVYKCIDVHTQKVLELHDVIITSGFKALPGILAKHFRKSYGLKSTAPLTDGCLFEGSIPPGDNFFITGKGIGFNYTPYEIGPYALGEVKIFVPFTELKEHLQTDFKIVAE